VSLASVVATPWISVGGIWLAVRKRAFRALPPPVALCGIGPRGLRVQKLCWGREGGRCDVAGLLPGSRGGVIFLPPPNLPIVLPSRFIAGGGWQGCRLLSWGGALESGHGLRSRPATPLKTLLSGSFPRGVATWECRGVWCGRLGERGTGQGGGWKRAGPRIGVAKNQLRRASWGGMVKWSTRFVPALQLTPRCRLRSSLRSSLRPTLARSCRLLAQTSCPCFGFGNAKR